MRGLQVVEGIRGVSAATGQKTPKKKKYRSHSMRTTHLAEIPGLEDDEPIMCVEGKVKYAGDLDTGKTKKGGDWSKQFFVLLQDGDEVGCTMWDAEGSEMEKGESVRIEATQNKKKQWTGIKKSSYEKTNKKTGEDETVHTIEIQANNVKITQLEGGKLKPGARERGEDIDGRGSTGDPGEYGDGPPDDQLTDDPGGSRSPGQAATKPRESQPELPKGQPKAPAPAASDEDEGVKQTRAHIMKLANLHCLCVDAVNAITGPHLKELGLDTFLNCTFMQATISSLFIEASGRRSDDGVTWWSYVDKMPTHPLKAKE